MKYESHITYHSKDMANVNVFEKWVKLQCQKSWYLWKGLVIRNPHTKYESPSKDMANVKVFVKWVKLQGQDHMVKNFGTNRKVLS
jgi:hypothetical protein